MGPLVTYGNLVETFPYDSPVYMLRISGVQLRQMMLYMLRDEVWQGVHSSFLQLSGKLKVVYSIPESRMESFTFDGKPIADGQLFTVGVQQYQYNNFKRIFNVDIADIEKNGKAHVVSTSVVDILEEYLSEHQHIDREIDGRLTLIR